MKHTKEILTHIVKNSKTISEVVRKLGLKEAGGNHSHIKRRIKQEEIDCSHFISYKTFLRPGINKKKWQDVLVLRESGKRTPAKTLRRAMVEYGLKYCCAHCGQNNIWIGRKLTLEVNHKNRNWLDNRINNIEFICPNCHSQL